MKITIWWAVQIIAFGTFLHSQIAKKYNSIIFFDLTCLFLERFLLYWMSFLSFLCENKIARKILGNNIFCLGYKYSEIYQLTLPIYYIDSYLETHHILLLLY